jgi:PAS domain-containing protein
LLVLCGVLLATAVTTGTWGTLYNLHNRALADSSRELRNVALVLAEQIDRAFQALELVETSLMERMQTLGISSDEDYDRQMSDRVVHLMLKDKISGLPHVDAVTIINSQGKLINFSRYWPIPAVNISDRDYFTILKSDTGSTSYLSEPVLNRGTGTRTIYLARKFAGPNGEFLGLVLGAMQLEYFEKLFGAIALGEDAAISVFRSDGVPLANYPRRDFPEGPYAQGNVPTKVLSPADRGVVRLTGIVDGQERLVAGHNLAHYPAVVAVGTSVAAVLAEWRVEAEYLVGAAVLIIRVLSGIVVVVAQQIKSHELLTSARAERAEAESARAVAEAVAREREEAGEKLGEQREQLDTALSNMSQGLAMFDAAARLVVCNQRYIQMYGLSAEAIGPGCTVRELIEHRVKAGSFVGDPDEYVCSLVAQIASRTASIREVKLEDGRVFCVSNQPMANGGWVATHEDITARRRAERDLERTRKFLTTVIENVPVSIIVRDARDMRYVLINRAGEKYFGMSRAHIIGKTAEEIFSKALGIERCNIAR